MKLIIFLLIYLCSLYSQTELDVEKFRIYPGPVTQTEPIASVHPLNNSILFASAVTINTSNGFISEGVYTSSDGGINWDGSDTCKGALIFNHGGDPGVVITEGGRLVISHIGSASLFPGMYVHYSDDMGGTWSNAYEVTDNQTGDKGTIARDNSDQSVFKGRIYLAWTDVVSPFAAMSSYSTDDGETWSIPDTVNPNPPQRCIGGSIATGGSGNVYVTWSGITTVTPFREDYAGFAFSSDGGVSWNVQQNIFNMNGISGTLPSKGNIRSNGLPQVAVDISGGSRNGWIYIITTELNNPPAGSDPDIILHRSTDNGDSWSDGIRVNKDPVNNGKIQYFPLLEIDDNGMLNILFYDDRNTTSDSSDVFLTRSADGGNTWKEYSIKNSRFKPKPVIGGSSNYQGDHVSLLAVNNLLYAFWMADYTGIYQVWLSIIDASVLSADDHVQQTVKEFNLQQNYPNPFNPSTIISWVIPDVSHVTLKVYDILGNEIADLVNEEMTSGFHKKEFSAENLPSGIYFYQLNVVSPSGNLSETKKMLLLK